MNLWGLYFECHNANGVILVKNATETIYCNQSFSTPYDYDSFNSLNFISDEGKVTCIVRGVTAVQGISSLMSCSLFCDALHYEMLFFPSQCCCGQSCATFTAGQSVTPYLIAHCYTCLCAHVAASIVSTDLKREALTSASVDARCWRLSGHHCAMHSIILWLAPHCAL